MAWLDDLLGKRVVVGSTTLPDRKVLRFVQGDGATVSVADNAGFEDTGSTDVTIKAGGAAVSSVADVNLTANDSGSKYNNSQASGNITLNLPASPPVGTTFHARVLTANYIIFKANTGQTIRDDSGTSGVAGTIKSNYVGATISIEAITSTLWLVTVTRGLWDLT